ncbi:MAG: hypothetical protein RL368_554 [Pseudomonadota bacterium]|jgi:hypothetical protein
MMRGDFRIEITVLFAKACGMALVMSLGISLLLLNWDTHFFYHWLQSFLLALLLAPPTMAYLMPLARKLVMSLIFNR